MSIMQALGIKKRDVVVLVGGGGKTTIMNRLLENAVNRGYNVLVTTTTRMYPPVWSLPGNLVLGEVDLKAQITDKLRRHGYTAAGRGLNAEHKITGFSAGEVDKLCEIGDWDLLLVEGDGAKGKPFKAPRSFEPVIPGRSTMVVPVIGVECIGKPLTEDYFHAVEQIVKLVGLKYRDTVGEEIVASILLHEKGYRKNVPPRARWIPFINKVENEAGRVNARKLAHILKARGVERVIAGAAANPVPVKDVH